MTSSPNLFVVGAMKAGTTSLHRYLDRHPAIHMSEPKEPEFWQYATPSAAQIAEYRGLFEGTDARWRGEASTSYAKLPKHVGVADRIADALPDARIIYIMRDPIERTLSHYWFNWRKNDERRDLLDALKADSDYTDFSYYAMQLRPYLDRFGARQVYTLTLEALEADPASTLASLYGWLDVDPELAPTPTRRENVTPGSVLTLRRDSLSYALLRSRSWGNIGRTLVPPAIRLRLRGRFSEPVETTGPAVTDAIDWLRPRQLAETSELSALLGRSFDEWRTLTGTGVVD